MTTRFAEYAKRYYTRTEGNRVLFRGNISQDQMAHRLSKNGTVKYEPATLSRMLRGVRLPTAEQFGSFVEILELPSNEVEELTLALALDHADDKGFEIAISEATPVTKLLVTNIDLLRTAIDDGSFGYALTLLRALAESRHGFEQADGATPHLLRILVMTETERDLLLELLSDSEHAVEIDLVVPDDEYMKDHIAVAIDSLPLSEDAKAVARRRYLEDASVEEIADAVEMTDTAVLAWLEEIHGALLQRLARDPE